MEIDPKDIVDQAVEAAGRTARLNAAVAVTVAVLATFTGICKVKDDNIVQAMQQAQADKLDHWNFYQARNLRQELAQATAAQIELTSPGTDAAARTAAVAHWHQLAAEQAKKKDELRALAEDDQRRYDQLNYRDDQFDLSDAAIAIAIAMLAVASLTQLWPLYWAALVPTGFGIVMGLAGLLALPIHPTALVQLLS